MKPLSVLVLLALAAAPACAAEKSPPNVVLIVSDDHGWTDYGFMGHEQIRTPHLDNLASQSLAFPRGYVPSSLCCPSLASIITGRYPHQHKITCNDPPEPPGLKRTEPKFQEAFQAGREAMNRHLEAVPTLPRLLAKQGYLSLQTGKWWQGDYRRGGFTHGMTKGQRHGDDGLKIGRESMQPVFDFIKDARKEGKPFFVWYAPMMPHSPHNPPARLLAKYRERTPSLHVARYHAMVEWFDETCGELLGHLDREKLADNTLVVYVTDNGWIQDPNGAGSVRSKRTPYDAGLRTPILLRLPGRITPTKSTALASSVDLVPTILAAVGQKPDAELPGVNLFDAEAVRRRTAVYGACYVHTAVDLDRPAKNLQQRWVIEGSWKLIAPAAAEGKAELYDLGKDPKEVTNLAGEKSEMVTALRRKLDAWWTPTR